MKAVPQIIAGIVSAFSGSIGQIVSVGTNLIKGLWQGISDAGAWLWNKISGFFGNVVSRIKKFFGINSPSKLFAELGGYMGEGIGVGFEDAMDSVSNDMQKAIPTDFDLNTSIGNIGNAVASVSNVKPLNVTIPLTLDGTTLARIIAQLQWTQNAVYVRNLGTV